MIPLTITEFKLPGAVLFPSFRRVARLRPVRRKRSGGLRIIDVRATLERDRRHAMATPDRRTSRPSVIRVGRRVLEGIAVVEEAEMLPSLPPLDSCLKKADELGARFDLADWLLEARRRNGA